MLAAHKSPLVEPDLRLAAVPGGRPLRMVVGVTSSQTCLVLSGRLRALRLAGFEVWLVSSPGLLLNECAEAEGVAALPVRMSRGIAPFGDMLSFVRLLVVLWQVRPDLTDFSTPKAGLLGNVAAWMLRVPHRVYTLRGLKLESAQGLKRTLLLWAERVTANCADVVLCNSTSLRTAALALRLAPGSKLRMLGEGSSNGVDTARFSPGASSVRRLLGIADEELVIGFAGRLTRDKGIPELVTAFEQILNREPRCWLVLVGWFDAAEDALEARWRVKIAQHPRIVHTDFVSDMVPYYRAMDLLVLPTHREGFPNVVLEAASCGIPAITTESTGARDAVVPELTGLVIPPGMPEAVADAALRLLRDGPLRRRMGVAARAWVLERYSRERVLGLAVDFYRGLLRDGA